MSRTVVITGAGGGLGSIFAKEFEKTGYRVAILDFNIQAGQKVACEIEQALSLIHILSFSPGSRSKLQIWFHRLR